MQDVFNNSRTEVALSNLDFDTDAESLLIDLQGVGPAILKATVICLEDDSQANTEKLDITAHILASDSVTPAAGNQVAAFTQIVGSNTAVAATKRKQESIKINTLDGSTDGTGRYLQFKLAETNTYEGVITIVVEIPGSGVLPVTHSDNP